MPAAMCRIRFTFVNCFFVSGLLLAAASAQITSTPSSLAFANTYLGMESASKSILVTNNGTATTTITAITSSCREFLLASGQVPATLAPRASTSFSTVFVPDSAKAFSCTYTLTQQVGSPLAVPLTGTGLATNAVVGVSPTSLSFPNQSEGTQSATQLLTISNTGTAAIKLEGITITPKTFVISPVSLPITINPGSSTTLSVSYSPTRVTSETGVLGMTFNQIPVKVVDLSGNGSLATSARQLAPAEAVRLKFRDGERNAIIDGAPGRKAARASAGDTGQGDLF